MRRLYFLLLFFSPLLHAQTQESTGPKTIVSYTFGRYTPIGVRFTIEGSAAWAFFLESRMNFAAFIQDKYVIRNGRIDDAAWIWDYTGKKRYGRADILAGINFPIITHMRTLASREDINVSLSVAGGMLYARYLYQYNRHYASLSGTVWVRDLGQGAVGFDMETGLQTVIGRRRIFMGCSGLLHKTERMIVMGIGVPVYN